MLFLLGASVPNVGNQSLLSYPMFVSVRRVNRLSNVAAKEAVLLLPSSL